MPSRRLLPSASAIPTFWIFLLAFAIRLLVLIHFSNSPHFIPDGDDMKFYSDWALRITHGQWTDHKAFYGLPGYAFCLAAIYKVSGGLDPFAAGLLQALMDAGVAALLYRIACAVFAPSGEETGERLAAARPRAIGIGAALMWMFFTPAQTFSMILMPTIWLVLSYYTCVWWAVKTQRSSWWKPWLGLGIFAGVIAMLVATILFAIPLLLGAIFLSVERGAPLRARLPRIAAAVLALAGGLYIGAAPAWIHNYFVAHEPVMLSAHSGINFWIGNNPTANGYPKMPPGLRASQDGLLKDSITMAEKEAGKKLTRTEVSRFWKTKTDEYIRENRPAWLRLMATKFANFWNAYQYDDVGAMKRLSDDGILPPGLRFGLIAALGLAGLFPAILLFPRSRWVAAAVVLHMCALMPVFVTERYRLAAVPGLMILAAFGLWQLWVNLVRGRWLGVGAYLALALGTATFVSIPRADPGLWSLDFYNAGIRSLASAGLNLADGNPALARRDFDTAQRNFETAYAYVPNNTEINYGLGNLWFNKSNFPGIGDKEKTADHLQAEEYYRRVLKLDPNHVGTLTNYGMLQIEEKRWDIAEILLNHATSVEPDAPKSFYQLALARYHLGNLNGARDALGKALTLRPNQKELLELRDKLAAPQPTLPSAEGAPQPEPVPK